MIAKREMLTARRAEALFTSFVPTGARLNRAETTAAIREAIRAHRGLRGVVGDVAAEFGDYPESAVRRMRWARRVVVSVYPG